jgi:hypothetical protein
MLHRFHALAGFLFAGTIVCAACSDGATGGNDAGSGAASGSSSSGGDGGTVACTIDEKAIFVSQTTDFTGFCNWANAPATAEGDASDGIHGLGPLRVYWNKPLPHACGEFPVGTIILKESEDTDPTKRTVFAMVKREARGNSDAYNSSGAAGWEWWSLIDNGDCTVSRLWRGTAPGSAEAYAGTPAGDCNGCHGIVKDNDYVWTSALQLSSF